MLTFTARRLIELGKATRDEENFIWLDIEAIVS